MFPQDTQRHPVIHMGILLSRMSIRLSLTMRPSHLVHSMGPSCAKMEYPLPSAVNPPPATTDITQHLSWEKANVMPRHNSSAWRRITVDHPVHRPQDSDKMASAVTEMSLVTGPRICPSHLGASRIERPAREQPEIGEIVALTVTELAAVVEEIAPVLVGGWIQKIYQPTDRTLVLEIRAPGHTHRLLISCHQESARLHFATDAFKNPPTPPSFCQFLRAHLQGARIDRIEQIPEDRIVEIALTTKEGPCRLVAELTGKTANILVLDETGHVRRDLNRVKNLEGQPYAPPTRQHRERDTPEHARFGQAVSESPFPLSAAIEAHYHKAEAVSVIETLRNARAGILRKSIKKLRRRIEAWHEDLAKAEKYKTYDRYGELIKANLGTIRRGQTDATVVDYFDEALPHLTIPLDQTKTPQGNMDDYFRKHRKHLAAEQELRPRIAEGERELESLQAELAAIEQGAWQPPEKPRLTTRVGTASRAGGGKSRQEPRQGPFRRFTSSDGLAIYVGRNARENDELTFGLAKSDDLWLHARGTPGSHVVVRLEKGNDPPPETIRDAATLALLYSDLKKSGKGDVIYTRKKWVKKAKGQAPGAVTVSQERSVFVALDKTRLAGLKERSEAC